MYFEMTPDNHSMESRDLTHFEITPDAGQLAKLSVSLWSCEMDSVGVGID